MAAPMLLGAPKAGPAAAEKRQMPNFSGEWILERSENHAELMRAIGYSALIAQTACRAEARQTIEHADDEVRCRFETVPPLAPARFTVFRIGGGEEVKMLDDVGRETVLVKPSWSGQTLAAGVRYLKSGHELKLERYMEDDRMVERLRYPGKGVEMRRVFRRSD